MDLQNLLIFRIGHLGDTVIALPALWAIRDAFPSAHLTLLTNIDAGNPHYVSPRNVLPERGLIDDFLAYPTNLGFAARLSAFFTLWRTLRKGKFDAVLYLMPRIRTAVQIDRDKRFFRVSGIKKVIGTDYLRRHGLSGAIPKPTPAVDLEGDFLLDLLESEGIAINKTNKKTDLLLTTSEVAAARNWLASESRVSGRKLLAVAPGSKWPSKIWDEQRFGDVVDRLIVRDNCYPIIFGGGEDHETGDRLIGRWKTGANSAGALDIRESAALLRDCGLYLGNDTGTMHIAAAVGVPCVAIFAATDWRGRWWPFGERNTVFRKTVECEGCLTPDCFNRHKCLNLVGTDEVYEACARTISEGEK